MNSAPSARQSPHSSRMQSGVIETGNLGYSTNSYLLPEFGGCWDSGLVTIHFIIGCSPKQVLALLYLHHPTFPHTPTEENLSSSGPWQSL